MLWTTKYIDAAVAQLRAEGHEIREEDIARLSPLKHRNLNLLGRYSFTASTAAAGALRPLRNSDGPELDDDDDGAGLKRRRFHGVLRRTPGWCGARGAVALFWLCQLVRRTAMTLSVTVAVCPSGPAAVRWGASPRSTAQVSSSWSEAMTSSGVG